MLGRGQRERLRLDGAGHREQVERRKVDLVLDGLVPIHPPDAVDVERLDRLEPVITGDRGLDAPMLHLQAAHSDGHDRRGAGVDDDLRAQDGPF